MNIINADLIVLFSLAAAGGALFSAIKMYKTELPQLHVQQPLKRDF